MVGRERVHEPEHAWLFQVREFSASEFSMVARPSRDRLSAAAFGYSVACRNFVLHIPFALLHAGYLSRSVAADKIPARFCFGGFIFSTARGRTDCAGGRFSSAIGTSAAAQDQPVSMGPRINDAWPVRENCSGRHS